MLLQRTMIERVRELCQDDIRLMAALMYGSFTYGEGDQFSDIEFALFFTDESFPTIDQQAWVAQIAPLGLYFADDNGHYTAIFNNLIRGEFHFEPASKIPTVVTWRENAWFPSAESAILLDRTGALAHYLQSLIGSAPERDTSASVTTLAFKFMNWMLFGSNVLARGEFAHALALLSIIHTYLLKLSRLVEDTTEHWPTPSKRLEHDLSAQAYERFRACTANLDRTALEHAYRETWTWGCELMQVVAQRHQVDLPTTLLDQLTERITMGDRLMRS